MSTVKSDFSLRFQTLRSRGLDRGWTLARLEQRSCLTKPTVDFVARRSLQAPCGASSSCASRPGVTIPNVVVVPVLTRDVPCRSVTTKVQCLSSTQGVVPPPRTHAAPVVQQAPLLPVSPSINLHDAVQALIESDDEHHRSFIDQHRVLSTCTQ